MFAPLFLVLPAFAVALQPTTYTPSGRPIYNAPSGSRVLQNKTNLDVFARNGTLLHVFENVLTGSGAGVQRRQDTSVGQIYTTLPANANATLQSFNSTFVVPPAPTTFTSQYILLAQGMTTLDDTGAPEMFMGVALQYGGSPSGGGSFYTVDVLFEFVSTGDLVFFGAGWSETPLAVNQTLSVTTTFIGNGSEIGVEAPYVYEVFLDLGTGSDAEFLADLEIGQNVPPQVVGFRLEEEGVDGPGEYPTGPLVFKDVAVELTTGFPKGLEWEVDGANAVDVDFEVRSPGPTPSLAIHHPRPSLSVRAQPSLVSHHSSSASPSRWTALANHAKCIPPRLNASKSSTHFPSSLHPCAKTSPPSPRRAGLVRQPIAALQPVKQASAADGHPRNAREPFRPHLPTSNTRFQSDFPPRLELGTPTRCAGRDWSWMTTSRSKSLFGVSVPQRREPTRKTVWMDVDTSSVPSGPSQDVDSLIKARCRQANSSWASTSNAAAKSPDTDAGSRTQHTHYLQVELCLPGGGTSTSLTLGPSPTDLQDLTGSMRLSRFPRADTDIHSGILGILEEAMLL
uniref:Uncharacterized protein n=1 Tax=Mycena chlorophos TaxID=658473 RepID=A0ABQ0LJL7_MYCCL|nr:predicted protein [Mycena chlorophos]